MNNKDFINSFSQAIISLDNKGDDLPLSHETKDHLSVYKVNLLYGLNDRLREDFSKVYLYLEDNNFTYLVREFIKTGNLESANYYDVAENFLKFLGKSYAIHQDDFVYFLGVVDSFWSFGNCHTDIIPDGILQLWLSLENDIEEEITIKLEQEVKISITSKNDQKFLRVTD